MMNPDTVLNFWFNECSPKDWFTKSEQFDARLREKFAATHAAIMRGDTSAWRTTPEGRLAEIIVLDQFSRNMFRGTADAFASDSLALMRAHEAIAAGADTRVSKEKRHFFYMPLMHSEHFADHRLALWLFLKSFN